MYFVREGRDFSDSPVVKIPSSQCRSGNLIPCVTTKTQHSQMKKYLLMSVKIIFSKKRRAKSGRWQCVPMEAEATGGSKHKSRSVEAQKLRRAEQISSLHLPVWLYRHYDVSPVTPTWGLWPPEWGDSKSALV